MGFRRAEQPRGADLGGGAKVELSSPPVEGVCGRSFEVIQMALMLKKKYELPQVALISKPRNYTVRIIDSGCGRTVVNEPSMLSGNVVSFFFCVPSLDPFGSKPCY